MIIEEVYPQELRDLYHGPNLDRGAVENWFMHSASLGKVAASKNAQFYILLNEGVPQSAEKEKQKKQTEAILTPSLSKTRSSEETNKERVETPKVGQNKSMAKDGPTVHMDFQIHISPDAGPEQIEAIFAAMAKHLYEK